MRMTEKPILALTPYRVGRHLRRAFGYGVFAVTLRPPVLIVDPIRSADEPSVNLAASYRRRLRNGRSRRRVRSSESSSRE
jgi:hypothetical protein